MMHDIHCATLHCGNRKRGIVIARTNGTAGEFYCAECRKWSPWRSEAWLTPPARTRTLASTR